MNKVDEWRQAFIRYMDTAQAHVGKPILEKGAWNDDVEGQLKQAIQDFNASWSG